MEGGRTQRGRDGIDSQEDALWALNDGLDGSDVALFHRDLDANRIDIPVEGRDRQRFPVFAVRRQAISRSGMLPTIFASSHSCIKNHFSVAWRNG